MAVLCTGRSGAHIPNMRNNLVSHISIILQIVSNNFSATVEHHRIPYREGQMSYYRALIVSWFIPEKYHEALPKPFHCKGTPRERGEKIKIAFVSEKTRMAPRRGHFHPC